MELEYQLDRALSKIHSLEVELELAHSGIKVMEEKITKLQESYGTMLVWMVGSAGSPLRADEVENLIKMLK